MFRGKENALLPNWQVSLHNILNWLSQTMLYQATQKYLCNLSVIMVRIFKTGFICQLVIMVVLLQLLCLGLQLGGQLVRLEWWMVR